MPSKVYAWFQASWRSESHFSFFHHVPVNISIETILSSLTLCHCILMYFVAWHHRFVRPGTATFGRIAPLRGALRQRVVFQYTKKGDFLRREEGSGQRRQSSKIASMIGDSTKTYKHHVSHLPQHPFSVHPHRNLNHLRKTIVITAVSLQMAR